MAIQVLGGNISAEKLCDYLNSNEVREEYGIGQPISLATAQRYLDSLGYQFSHPPKGQFVDGHERDDVVDHRQNRFLPQVSELLSRMHVYDKNGQLVLEPVNCRIAILWFHDESIFYAHDRRAKHWYHKDAPAKPYPKGEGLSFMVANYVSADYGWLKAPDGRTAQVTLKPGKGREGYMTNEDILAQLKVAVALAKELYPDNDHYFIYDNVTTHLKRPDGSLSARHMPKSESLVFGADVPKRDAEGKVIPGEKQRVPMHGASFNGESQPLYFPPEDGVGMGTFKGMERILAERGIETKGLKAECKEFKCAPPQQDCCMRQVLYNEPDFQNVESNLEILAKSLGVQVIFLPKYHCELNFIEQCWGYAKRLYRLNPESSREDVLEKNTLEAVDGVPLVSMRRFANRSLRFMDAYRNGLDGKQAAWAIKKYRGHCILPSSWRKDLDEADK
ncbi:hypothetical protein H1R20_g13591, partial [Candolleomyces eurysporus]